MPFPGQCGESIGRHDLDLVCRLVLKLGGYAERLIDVHDFGFEKDVIKTHIGGVYEHLVSLRAASEGPFVHLSPPSVAEIVVEDDTAGPRDHIHFLRLASGAIMLSQKYRKNMSTANLWKSTTAKILHKYLIGIMDDIVDAGEYGYLEAKDLHHTVLSSMIDPQLDVKVLMHRLMSILKQRDLDSFDLIIRIVKNFNELYNSSPHGFDLFYQMEVLDKRTGLSEALTTYQKASNLDIVTMERIASSFYAPSHDLAWHERLAAHFSPTSRYNLVDMAFCEELTEAWQRKTFLSGWYYTDAAAVLLDHVVHIAQDLRGGVANLSLIAFRGNELKQLKTFNNYNPRLSNEEYEKHLFRIAELASRGLNLLSKDSEDPELFLPFISVMMPVVVMADCIAAREEMIHTYIRGILPTLRRVAMRCQDISVARIVSPVTK